MRTMKISPALLIAALLAILLLAYVFAGGGQAKRATQTRCASREAFDQINRELFRRAAALRPDHQAALQQVAAYSVVRRASQLRRQSEPSGRAQCAGTIALDLPPGIAASGGQHSFTADVTYGLAPRSSGKVELLALGNAEGLVRQLATLVEGPGRAQAPVPIDQQPPAAETNDAAETDVLQPPPPPPRAPAAQHRPAPPHPAPALTARKPVAPAARPVAEAAKPPAPKPAPGTARSADASSTPSSRPPAPTPTPRLVSANPSFNCRYARTKGEIAVCRDQGLASLDRQMAAEFNRALSRASPGAKLILQRTRKSFLRYRDSCGSDACIAQAYQGRMAEIEDIAGRY